MARVVRCEWYGAVSVDRPLITALRLKKIFFLNSRKCSVNKGLSIDTTHTLPPVPLDSTFKGTV
jgi:hypothetical protein